MGNQERIHLVKILIYLMHEILYSFSLYFIVLFCIGVRLGLYNEGYWLIILFCNIYIYIFVLVLLFIIIRYRSPMLHLIMYYCFRKGMKAALPLNTFIKKKKKITRHLSGDSPNLKIYTCMEIPSFFLFSPSNAKARRCMHGC
jgi:hypothetical protein